ncbi:glycosyltransferase family 4 protein [Aerosakkonema funiforme]|uniref:glycosyltransferase family 4 protein n=1 Tax=Aerosakkonema funiforme TaxID=1246630 RepID=UPI0035B7EB83
MKQPTSIVCCTPFWGDNWKWFAPELDREQLRWYFYADKSRGELERYLRTSVFRTCLEAVRCVKQQQADLLFTHNPRLSLWCVLFATLLGVQTNHIAYSFNFHNLPHGLRYHLYKWACTKISKFVVYSQWEKEFYSEYFDIPPERIEMRFWSMAVPQIEPEEPLETGDYICAIGGNARDYETLMAAMAKLPDIKMVIVVRPHNLKNLSVPPNVKALVNIAESQAMNILKYSRFMVLPLKGSEVPCGHITLVAAMHLGKAFIITNSIGVSDYVLPDRNAITCEAFSPDALAKAIRNLWNDPAKCQQLGENGRQFAQKYCASDLGRQHLQRLLFDFLNADESRCTQMHADKFPISN